MATFPVSRFYSKNMYFLCIFNLLAIANLYVSAQLLETVPDANIVTFETLYKSGKTAYTHQRWLECYEFMHKALEDYKFYKTNIIECKTDCNSKITATNKEHTFTELSFYNNALHQSVCFKKCKNQKFTERPHLQNMKVSKEIRDIFDINLKIYDYLQICAFKLEKVQEAASAAYTFYLANPGHEVMRNNIKYYQDLPQLKEDDFVDLEKRPYQAFYEHLVNLYGAEEYVGSAQAAEDTLREFYGETRRCRAVCDSEVEPQAADEGLNDIYGNIADLWVSVLECQIDCESRLSTFDETNTDFLPELYNYLQFSYYKAGVLDKAAAAAASYLLFRPADEVMTQNKAYYIKSEGLTEEHFVPLEAAVNYYDHIYLLQEMQEYVNSQYKMANTSEHDSSEMGKFKLEGPLGKNKLGEKSYQEDGKFEPEGNTHNNKKNNPAERRKGDPELSGNASQKQKYPQINPTNAAALAALGPRDEAFLTSLENYLEQNKLQLYAEEVELRGKTRVVVDGLLTEKQCQGLTELVKEGGSQSDGYQGSEHKSSPHTAYEHFQGITVAKAAELATTGKVASKLTSLYLKAAESSRHFLETYYNLRKGSLYFHYTHLVCRTALENQAGRQDLSHPLHADNCVMQIDKTCIRARPAYTERDFSALLYLNDDFEGGDFFFADREHAIQTRVSPSCGRMVGFEAGTFHGVEAVQAGTRCAVALWFTLDVTSRELAHEEAGRMLQGMTSREKPLENPALSDFVASHGYNLVMTESELNGPERFVADQMASQEQCNAVMKLAREFGVVGDGYTYRKDKQSPHNDFEEFKGVTVTRASESGGYTEEEGPTSPHTDHEVFEGLTLIRAAQLAASREASAESVRLYLQLSEDSIQMVQRYFNLQQPLYFDFTHLACRTALDDSKIDRIDLSHPVHSDNCNIRPNGDCIRAPPAYTQRDYSALLYLNDDFIGGDFFFAHKNFSVQSELRPKCGRLVGFNASNFHGVKAVLGGQRCAIALWFTLDPKHKEAAHGIAWNILKNIDTATDSNPRGETEINNKGATDPDMPGSTDTDPDLQGATDINRGGEL